uniref:Uncharacterized protein n=1 Tax=Acrobeloides nanus TaxID=290746 RepID=A0A914CN20_9BILA
MQICKNGEDPKVWFNFEYALWSLNKQALNYFLLVENELINVENDEIHVYLPNDSIDIFMQILVEEFRSSSCPDKFIKTLYIFRQEDTSSENICLMFFRRIYVNPEEDNEIVVTRETDSWTLHINVCNEENFILVSKKFNK